MAADRSACSGGLAILLEQGMGAWIELCSRLLPDPSPTPQATSDSPPRPTATGERELVVMVTQMILSTAKELA